MVSFLSIAVSLVIIFVRKLIISQLYFFIIHKTRMLAKQISLDNFKSGRLHTLITSAFSHIDGGHLIANMIGLYVFGKSVRSHATNLFPY